MLRQFAKLALLMAVGVACGFGGSASAQSSFNPFTVSVTLSPRAGARLASLQESITIIAMFYGDPIPAARRQANNMGEIELGEEQVVILGQPGRATITGRTVEGAKIGLLRNGTVKVLINVTTARRKNPDNLLNCDIFEDSVAVAERAPVHIGCKLIEEGF